MNSLVMANAVPGAVQALTLPWQGASGTSSTNEAYLVPQTEAISTAHFQKLRCQDQRDSRFSVLDACRSIVKAVTLESQGSANT